MVDTPGGEQTCRRSQDFVEACRLDESNVRAAVGQGEVLHQLKRPEVRTIHQLDKMLCLPLSANSSMIGSCARKPRPAGKL